MDSNVRSTLERTGLPPDAGLSVDALEQTLLEAEREIARYRAVQLAALELLDRAQVAIADGARTLEEWLAARLDVGHDTSRSVVQTMRRTEHRPDLREALARGGASFDRIDAAGRIAEPAPDPLFQHLDVEGVRREAVNRARITATDETHTFLDNHLIMQPTPRPVEMDAVGRSRRCRRRHRGQGIDRRGGPTSDRAGSALRSRLAAGHGAGPALCR